MTPYLQPNNWCVHVKFFTCVQSVSIEIHHVFCGKLGTLFQCSRCKHPTLSCNLQTRLGGGCLLWLTGAPLACRILYLIVGQKTWMLKRQKKRLWLIKSNIYFVKLFFILFYFIVNIICQNKHFLIYILKWMCVVINNYWFNWCACFGVELLH